MRSLSEIDTVSKRASRAAGFDWGVAEEVGKNTRLLEIFGIPGIKNLNSYLRKRKKNFFEKINHIAKKNKKKKKEYCPIMTGVNFLDQSKNFEKLNNITFQNMAFPLLFLPFVSRTSEIVGKKILFEIDNKIFLLNYNNSIFVNSFKIGNIITTKKVKVKFLDNLDSFKEIEWKELYTLSEKTFVEESDSLKKSAAGAGLTDND